jgi:tetratricopeptide (TPR) repeat protein
LSLLDVPTDDPEWPRLDPLQRRRRTLDAVKRLLLRESQGQPLLLVFEDLHWIDSETQAVLDGLVESLPTAQLLLLVNYRPEYQHPWGSRTYYTQLRLDPLPPETAEQLLSALLGPDGSLDALKRVLITRTEGNPFFLEESVRSLAETGALVGGRGAYRASGPIHATQVPVTVQAVLAARIDRLAPEDKRLLQSASVIGKDVPFVLLHAVGEESEDALRHRLAQLQAAEFIYETSLFPDLEYTFKHALTHEVAYGSVLFDRRRGLHARIVEAIERLYPDRLAEHVEKLAYHAFKAEVWGKSVTYLRQAGAKAFGRSSNREAVAHLEQALTALPHLPETREILEQAVDLRFDLRNSLFPLADFGRIEECLREAEALARRLDDQRRLGRVTTYLCSHCLVTTGRGTDVRTFAQRVDAIAKTLGDLSLQVQADYYLAFASYISGDYHGTEAFCRKVMEPLHGDRIRERFGVAVLPAVHARAFLARSLAQRGAFDEGAPLGQEAIRIAEALDQPFSIVWAYLALASLEGIRGELNQAVRLLERAVGLSRDGNVPILTPIAMACLGHMYAWSGRIEEGLSCMQEALTAFESMEMRVWHTISIIQLGEAYLLADQVEDARACASRAVTLAEDRGERGYEAWARRLLGEIASHHQRPDVVTVEAHYGAAMALANGLGMRPLQAHCHLGFGKLSRRTGDAAQAREHLTTAATMYREMGMTFWLEKAEAGLGLPHSNSP